jgi:hypothetical protein
VLKGHFCLRARKEKKRKEKKRKEKKRKEIKPISTIHFSEVLFFHI